VVAVLQRLFQVIVELVLGLIGGAVTSFRASGAVAIEEVVGEAG
jgi:hypothetical protein